MGSKFVVDTSALISLGVGDCFAECVSVFDFYTTEIVREELQATAERDDLFAQASSKVLSSICEDQINLHSVRFDPSSLHNRIDEGEGSCIELAHQLEARYLVHDDHRAMFRIQEATHCEVITSPFILGVLLQKGILTEKETLFQLMLIAERRNWLDSGFLIESMENILKNPGEVLEDLHNDPPQMSTDEKMEEVAEVNDRLVLKWLISSDVFW